MRLDQQLSSFSCSSGLLMNHSQFIVLQLELITISGINLSYFSLTFDSSVHTNKKWYRFSGAALHNGQGVSDPLYLFRSSCSQCVLPHQNLHPQASLEYCHLIVGRLPLYRVELSKCADVSA